MTWIERLSGNERFRKFLSTIAPNSSDSLKTGIDSLQNQIIFETLDLEFLAFKERDREILTGIPNINRQDYLFYQETKTYLEKQDQLFRAKLPFEYNQTLQLYGSTESRWNEAKRIAKQVENQLHLGSPEQGGIVDCRAKSLFSIWSKNREHQLNPDEIFDSIGVRITTRDTQSARRMQKSLTAQNQLIQPKYFSNKHVQIHYPVSDTLDTPRPNGFSSLRMNFFDSKVGVFEVQIQTVESYLIWSGIESRIFLSGICSPKFGLCILPE